MSLRFALLLLTLPLAAFADLVKVDYATGINSSIPEQGTATQLVRSSVSELGHELTDDGGTADYTLHPHLMKLQTSYILTIEKTKKGRSVYSGQLKAAHLDELDKVAKRLTRAVIAEKPAGDDARVGEITDQEAHEGTQRKATRSVRGVSFGGGWLSNLGRSDVGYSMSLAQGWDVNRALIRLFGDLSISGGALLLNAGLGASVFLTDTDISPYLGADFGYGFARVTPDAGADTANGFAVGLDAGIFFLRTTSINVDLGGRLGFLLADTSLGRPLVCSVRVGVYF